MPSRPSPQVSRLCDVLKPTTTRLSAVQRFAGRRVTSSSAEPTECLSTALFASAALKNPTASLRDPTKATPTTTAAANRLSVLSARSPRTASGQRKLGYQGDRVRVRKLQLGPRTRQNPMAARFRVCEVVTRARAGASAGQPAGFLSLLLSFQGLPAGWLASTMTFVIASGAAVRRVPAAWSQVRVMPCSRRYPIASCGLAAARASPRDKLRPGRRMPGSG